jgi:enoyl-[acyl-carrier-protein] reductase (NADH)
MSLQGEVAMITVGITALVLASDEAQSITGTELVDGSYKAA